MKNYRAVIIDGRKFIKYLVITLIATAGICFIGMSKRLITENFSENMTGRSIIRESIPVFTESSANLNVETGFTGKIKRFFEEMCRVGMSEPSYIIAEEIPLIKVTMQGYLATIAQEGTMEVYNPQNADVGEGEPEPEMPMEGSYPIKSIDSSQAKALAGSDAKMLIRNETNYSINIEGMLSDELEFDLSGDGPQVLILHTHATESYTEEGITVYSPDKADRSLEKDKNVVAVGERMKQIFEKNGIETIHDETLHDHPNFNGSYANSLRTAEQYIKKYPTIKIVLDIHRDAYVYGDGSKAKFVTKVDGKDVAQLMIVVGTNAGGLEHPKWKENMKLALKLQNHISKSYPTLMRGVNLRKERFNGHVTTGSLIIEVGSSGNTLNEALLGSGYAAEKISEYLNSI